MSSPNVRNSVLPPSDDETTDAAIVAAFNTWAFKREQPSDVALLQRAVSIRRSRQQPIEFVLYWGKGPRAAPAKPERDCLDFLAGMTRRIGAVYRPGAVVWLILTDTHAALNGHPRAVMMSYFLAVGELARDRGFAWCLLSDIVRHHAGNVEVQCQSTRPAILIEKLERSAGRWYRGGAAAAQGAAAYYDMNMVEKRAVGLEFPEAIFLTFNGKDMRELFPDNLPAFHMYSVRKGISDKPWFIDVPEPDRDADAQWARAGE